MIDEDLHSLAVLVALLPLVLLGLRTTCFGRLGLQDLGGQLPFLGARSAFGNSAPLLQLFLLLLLLFLLLLLLLLGFDDGTLRESSQLLVHGSQLWAQTGRGRFFRILTTFTCMAS